jgi:hypothetical protein
MLTSEPGTGAGGGSYAVFFADGEPATNALLAVGRDDPSAVVVDRRGNLYLGGPTSTQQYCSLHFCLSGVASSAVPRWASSGRLEEADYAGRDHHANCFTMWLREVVIYRRHFRPYGRPTHYCAADVSQAEITTHVPIRQARYDPASSNWHPGQPQEFHPTFGTTRKFA